MENFATDSGLWAWIRSLAEGNMVIRGAITVIGIIFFIVLLGIGINLIGKHILGRSDQLFPALNRWFFRLLARWIPILQNRLRTYLEQTNKPKKPIKKRQRIVATVVTSILYVLMFALIWVTYSPNVFLSTYNTSLGGILVEVQARRQPTDGFQFDIQFDRPAKVIGVWSDVPSYRADSKQFNIRNEEMVGFTDTQNGTQNSVLAKYPIATPQRSVFVYFRPTDNNSQQLEVTKVNLQSGIR